jgi:ABC-type branched-subunit amino acid transport system ATPase component
LSGITLGTVTGANYDPIMSLTYVAVIVISVGGVPWYAVPTGILLSVFPAYVTSASTGYYLNVLFGVSAIAVAFGLVSHMPESVKEFLTRLGGKKAREGQSAALTLVRPQPQRGALTTSGESRLDVVDVTVNFGGLRAVDHLSFSNHAGVITGLIGPNGAGKTTTFNACSGLVALSSGRVLLNNQDISRLPMPARAERGLGRTFQAVDLLDSYSAKDNVRLAAEAALAGEALPRLLVGRHGDDREIAWRTADALETCGLTGVADTLAIRLSNQQRRVLGLARCLAAGFRIIMLDEPSAGLDARETAEFGDLLTSTARDRGLGIVLVEHDMSLVMAVCDEIYVLDFGKEVMHGTPNEVQTHPAVKAAYLGEETVTVTPAGGLDR